MPYARAAAIHARHTRTSTSHLCFAPVEIEQAITQGISVSTWAIIISNDIKHNAINNGIMNGIGIRINTITNIYASINSNTHTNNGIS